MWPSDWLDFTVKFANSSISCLSIQLQAPQKANLSGNACKCSFILCYYFVSNTFYWGHFELANLDILCVFVMH